MKKRSENIFTFGMIVGGCIVYGLASSLFIAPVNIIAGSTLGIAVVVQELTGMSIGTFTVLFNIPLMLIATKIFGKKILLLTILTICLNSVFTDLLAMLPPITTNPLLASILGGVVIGLGSAMIIGTGATTGGTSVITRIIIRRFPRLTFGTVTMILDSVIILSGSLILGDIKLMFYSVLNLFCCVVVMDKLMYGCSKIFCRGIN